MRIDVTALLLAAATTAPVVAQTVPVDHDTQVRSVSFEIPDSIVSEDEILERVAARGRGSGVGVRRVFQWVPFVPPVVDRPFDPFELQRDRERIRRFLAEIGYPLAAVDYDVLLDEEDNVVDITFQIDAGVPVTVRNLSVEWTDSVPLSLDPVSALDDLRGQLQLQQGERLDSRLVPPAATALGRWLGNRGYAFAVVRPVVAIDSASLTGTVVLRARVGPRARIGQIDIEGNASLRTTAVRDFLTVEPGEWFSPERLQAGALRLSALDMISTATFEVPPGQPIDTLVDVTLRVREQEQRTVSGQAGYGTDGGLAGEAQWTHRNIFLGAQTLTFSLAGQSGILALNETPDEFIRGSLTFRQPIRGRSQLTLNAGPFVEFRDDFRDRSLELGLEATLLYQVAPLSSIALRYEIATRRIYKYRFGDISGGVNFLELLGLSAEGVLDSLGTRINSSVLSLSASLGSLDVATEPRRGFVVEPSVSVAFPDVFTAVEYVTLNLRASGYLPLGDLTLAGRAGAGRLYPYGESVPASQADGFRQYLRMRDVLYTAGGMSDVRGWTDRTLGPKFPDVVINEGPDSTFVFEAGSYTPLGGFIRLHGTAELRFPIPFLPDNWQGHTFLDAGRIRTNDERFTDPTDTYGVEGFFFGTGLGLDFGTPVGSIRAAIGYKLNPSILDLAHPADILDAILNDRPLDSAPRHNGRRFQFHLGIGRRL